MLVAILACSKFRALAIGTAAEMTASCAEPAAMLELMRPLEFMNWLALDVACCMSGLSCAMIDRTCPAVVSVVGFRTTFCAVAVVGLTFCAAPMMPGDDCATSIGCADCTVSHGRRADGLLTMGLTVTGVAMLYSLLCSPHCPTGRIMYDCWVHRVGRTICRSAPDCNRHVLRCALHAA